MFSLPFKPLSCWFFLTFFPLELRAFSGPHPSKAFPESSEPPDGRVWVFLLWVPISRGVIHQRTYRPVVTDHLIASLARYSVGVNWMKAGPVTFFISVFTGLYLVLSKLPCGGFISWRLLESMSTFPATGRTLIVWTSPIPLEGTNTWRMVCFLFFICAFSKMTNLEESNCSESPRINQGWTCS